MPFEEAAMKCENIGNYPVLVGEEGDSHTVLASPVILYDYPKIAPESAGNLFDGTEIDEILTLRILSMTDEEKSEMRQADERGRKMLERIEADPEHLAHLHGVMKAVEAIGLAPPHR
jgi:hydrogenase maturation protease